jgi:lipoprotein-releasing system ATP-binding protein
LEIAKEENTLLICVTHSLELAARFPRHVQLEDGQFTETGKRSA